MKNILLLLFISASLQLEAFADDELPIVPDGFAVDVVAREPMVSNPCVMAFDQQRICTALQMATNERQNKPQRTFIPSNAKRNGIQRKRRRMAHKTKTSLN